MRFPHPITPAPLPGPFTAALPVLLLFLLVSASACGQTDRKQEEEIPEPKVTHAVLLVTTLGEIEIELYGEDAPMTVANFVELVDSGYYNGILIHRVHPNFLIQTGDPATKDSATPQEKWGRGGESIYGGPFPDELSRDAPSFRRGYLRGVMAMANNGPNTNTSQFFILLRDIPKLPKTNTIFGRVVRGMEVVDSIAAVKLTGITEYGGRPAAPIAIISARTVPPRQSAKAKEED